MNGSMNERNCATRIRYSSSTDKREADGEAPERGAHAFDHAPHRDIDARRQLGARQQSR